MTGAPAGSAASPIDGQPRNPPVPRLRRNGGTDRAARERNAATTRPGSPFRWKRTRARTSRRKKGCWRRRARHGSSLRRRTSKFKVGAALETVDRQIITGCNIENATYGLTLCAERVALVKALSEGHTVFTRIAVVADTEAPTPPCGPCRQLLWEYCGDLEVVLGNLRAAVGHHRLAALLPLPFDRRLL